MISNLAVSDVDELVVSDVYERMFVKVDKLFQCINYKRTQYCVSQ